MKQTVIIQYNAGNVLSVQYALERIGVKAIISSDATIIQSADRVVFPGVGEASSAMAYLKENRLDTLIPRLQQPVLGICLGMQLMCSHSEENDTACMNIFEVAVKKFRSSSKVPQVGWNTIHHKESPLFKGLLQDAYVYYVHGYFAALCTETIATTQYQVNYSAAMQKNNFFGVQFHPEKSSVIGETILKNFINLSS
jgi:imidazole glycerol-phosphate synthase subunit HisH